MKPTVPPEPQLTRVQCGVCAWMSAAHESAAEAYLEVGAHFVNVHRYAATAVPVAAAPPTVAPAAEIAWRLVLASAIGDIALSLAERKTISKVITDALERDRASRSPGATATVEAAARLVERAAEIHRGYASEHDEEGDDAAVIASDAIADELERVATKVRALSSAGQEGRLRPGSDEGAAGKAHGAPLSGLDAATVEAAGLLATLTREARSHYDDDRCDLFDGGLANAMDEADAFLARRALATPPGQAKP